MELVNRIVPPKPTDEEIRAGKPKREAFRNKLLQAQKTLGSLRDDVSNPLDVNQSELEKAVDSNLAWVNANIEVSPNQVDVKETTYNEMYAAAIQKYDANVARVFEKNPKQEIVNAYPFAEGKKELQRQILQLQQKGKIEKQKKRQALEDRTYWDDFLDAFKSVFKWSLIVFIIFYGVRAASFAVNANLWRPLPYRILLFVYTFIFFPIWIPYYLYREIKHAIWPCIDEPHFESVFPITPYNPGDELDLNKRFFGYPNVPELCSWLEKKKDQWRQEQLEVLKPKVA
jgi:hypothetical protein